MKRFRAVLQATLLLAASIPTLLSAQLPRYGLSTRVENHMLPAVSTGPLHPTWSPDGNWIAFSMRGDIWKVRVDGGEAIALTQGPAYYFEPAWSPDGRTLAFSMDRDGALDIGVVSADGGDIQRLTNDPGVDIQPAWDPAGTFIYFASARDGSFDIYRITPTGTNLTAVVSDRGNQFQPTVSPDGQRLAFVSPVRGRLGSGGLWVHMLNGGETELVHYEETSYRPAPQWTPDGSALVYTSDAAGSYDIAVVPSGGGNRARLSHEMLDEFAPSVSPDGQTIAFVSNEAGPTTLYTMPSGGGARSSWREVSITKRTSRVSTGRISIGVVDSEGRTMPSRIRLLASDGRAYSPEGGFHRVSPVHEIHYFHSNGNAVVELPAGPAIIEVLRGFEYLPSFDTVLVEPNTTRPMTVQLERLVDAPQRGWYSGDTHVHDLHEGRFGLTQREFFRQHVADDLHVANALIHMDGTKIMGRWDDLTGQNFGDSNSRYILRYAQEFRGSYGHVGLLGVSQFITPLIAGTSGSPYAADVLKTRYLDGVVTAGGIGGFMHPYFGDVSDVRGAAQSDIPVHVALGKGQFFDIVSIASDERASAAMYYHMLNSGFRIAATGGTDNFGNVWRDPSGGTARTYAFIDGELSWENWIEAIRRGHTFATNGPLLFATVNGLLPGSEIRTDGNPVTSLEVEAEIFSKAPVDRVEVIVNGQVAYSMTPPAGATYYTLSSRIQLNGSGWVAVRAIGVGHRQIEDHYAFAHTTPVHIVANGRTFTKSEDAEFLLAVTNEIWDRVDNRDAWNTADDRERYLEQIEVARRAFRAAMNTSNN